MPKKKSETIQSVCYEWKLRRRTRDDIYEADGRSHGHGRYSLGARSRAEALEQLKKLDGQIAYEESRVGLEGDQDVDAADLSLEEGHEHWLAPKRRASSLGGVAPDTMKRYRFIERKFFPYCRDEFGIEFWQEVNAAVLNQYLDYLATELGLADATIRLEGSTLMSLHSWLRREGHLPDAR